MQYDENAEKYGYEGEMTPLKCDKLNAYKGDVTIPVYGTIADAEVYLKKEADEAIAELKDKCQMHDFFWEGCGFAKLGFKNTIAVSEAFDKLEAENAELKAKLENVQASMYADVVDANMENRRLKEQVHDYAQGLYVMQARAEKEARHNKYKRCVKNREICVMRFDIELARQYPTRCAFWSKWERKWLELAEKFKEEK